MHLAIRLASCARRREARPSALDGVPLRNATVRPASARLPGLRPGPPAPLPTRPLRRPCPRRRPPPRAGPELASLPHVTPSEVSEAYPGLIGSRQAPRSLPPCLPRSRIRAPSLGRHYPASRYYGPLRRTARSSWSSRVLGWRVHATDRASRVASTPLRGHAVARPPAERAGHVSLRAHWRYRSLAASPRLRRAGLRIEIFEACSAFTRVTACTPAEPPDSGPFHRSASVHVVSSANRSDCYRPE